MAVMTIRGLADEVRDKLRLRAAQHGRSMEAEVRAILTEAVRPESSWLQTWRERFHEAGGIDLDLPSRGSSRTPPDFTE